MRGVRLLRAQRRVERDRLLDVPRYALTSDPRVGVEIVSAALACCTLELQAALGSGALVESNEAALLEKGFFPYQLGLSGESHVA